MVVYLHDDGDTHAGADVAALYDTRTLHSIERVTPENRAKVLTKLLDLGMLVVVAGDFRRHSEHVNAVTTSLMTVGREVKNVHAYLIHLKKNEPATLPAHATHGLMEQVAG